MQRGERGEKGVQGDSSDVLSALDTHLPIQLAERYGEKMCFVKYHVSEDQSSVVRMTGGVQTLRNVSAYNEPTWYFNLSISKVMQRQTCRNLRGMDTFWR